MKYKLWKKSVYLIEICFKINFTSNLDAQDFDTGIFCYIFPSHYDPYNLHFYRHISRYYSIRMPTSIYGRSCAYLLRVLFQYKIKWRDMMFEERKEEKGRSDQIMITAVITKPCRHFADSWKPPRPSCPARPRDALRDARCKNRRRAQSIER